VNACPGCGFQPKPMTYATPDASRIERALEARSRATQATQHLDAVFLGAAIQNAITENA
jgi:hypothetical protein